MAYPHQCDLHEYVDSDLPSPSPYSHFIHRINYHLRNMITVHQTYESAQYFRSQASFRREKTRHLCAPEYRYIIHPFSRFVKREHMLMSCVWLFLFYYQPLCGSFFSEVYLDQHRHLTVSVVLYTIAITYGVLVFLDIVMRFFLGYIEEKTREIVLDHRRIVRHYLSTYFLVDFLPMMVFVVNVSFPNLSYRTNLLFFQLTSLRQFRMVSAMQGVNCMLHHFRFSRTCRVSFIIYLMYILMVHWWTCLLKFIDSVRKEFDIPRESSWYVKLTLDRSRGVTADTLEGQDDKSYVINAVLDYFQYMNVLVCHSLGAGVGNYHTQDTIEMFVLAIFLVFSMVVYLLSLAILLQYFGQANASEFKFEEVIAQLQEYMLMKRFAMPLRRRIHKYYEYKFNKKFFSEKEILGTLTEHLEMEILLYSCQNMVKKVSLFKGLSKEAVGCILALLRQEIYLSGDVVMASNEETDKLYFILFGTCAVQLANGKEAMHIEDGSLFGENREFSSVHQDFIYSVVAIEPCEIYSLGADDIRYCCKHYPEIRLKIDIMSKTKVKLYTMALSKAAFDDSEISASDIAAELRRGKILQQRRTREYRSTEAN